MQINEEVISRLGLVDNGTKVELDSELGKEIRFTSKRFEKISYLWHLGDYQPDTHF